MAIPPAGATSYLSARTEFLAKTQNSDGGWGYFPGKQSWIEPTAWSLIALHGRPESTRAWQRILSWQGADGSWRAGQDVQVNSWATALCVTIAHARNEFGEPYKRGLHWLLNTSAAETNLKSKLLTAVGFDQGRNTNHKAWPWKPGDSSWIEPTAHSLVALKFARKRLNLPEISKRIEMGEAAILDQRCRDAGWNYGNTRVLGNDLPSYPETTGLALLGLQQSKTDLSGSLQLAEKVMQQRQGRMASAWLTIALRLHGRPAPESQHLELSGSGDILVTALEAIGVPGGPLAVLRTGDGA